MVCASMPSRRLDLSAFYAVYRDDGSGPGGARSGDDGRAVALRLRDRGALVAADRAALHRGRRHARDLRQPGARITRRSRASASATRRALAGLFGEVLALCAEAGLVRVGVIAVDGTKVHANAVAARDARLRADRARDPRRRRRRSTPKRTSVSAMRAATSCPPSWPTAQGRQRWLRDAKRRLDERRAAGGPADPASRPERLKEAKRRLEEEHRVECRANAAYEDYRRHGRDEERPPVGRAQSAQALPAARAAGGQDQPHRSGLAQRQDAARLGAGLQRPGGHDRGSDRHRRRGHTSPRPTSASSSR